MDPNASSTAEGIVLIVRADSAAAPDPTSRVAGLSIVRRIALASERANLVPVLAPGVEDPDPADAPATDLASALAGPLEGRRRVIVCPANVIPQTRWLRALAQSPVEAEALYVDDSMVAVLESEDPGKVLAEAARCPTAGELVALLAERFRRLAAPFEAGGRFLVTSDRDLPAAERWLLRGLVKDSEGFMSRHFERRLSLAVTRRLVWTRITPNAMTLISIAVGLASAPFFLRAEPAWQVVGALIFLTHSILDGCDGELARLKFLESRTGAMLDFWGDNVVHVAVFGCMAVGWSFEQSSGLPLLLGLAAIGAVGVATAVLSSMGMQPKPVGAEATARVVDALANRDFIYVVLALSFIGRAWWFVAIVAIGTPMFVLAAIWANRHRRV